MPLSREAKIALAIAVPAVVVGVGYIIYRAQAALKRYLYISAGEGGTTYPPPGTYQYKVGENVTITAIPYEGYTVGTWTVDGVDWGHRDAITITMDANHSVIVTFWPGGKPPATVPVGIKSLGSVTVISNVGAWLTGTPGVWQCAHVAHCDENWRQGLVKVPMKFMVYDAAGNGVPEVDVALWTEPPPDTGKYRGVTLLDGTVHIETNPVVKKTDENGVVSVDVSYCYGLNDKFKALCRDANIGFQFGCFVLPCVTWAPVYDGYCIGTGCYVCWTSGECETGLAGCEKMDGWALNRVYARIVGTTRETFEIAYCGFHVKWI
ncbi:MAG: hypothetical protein QXO67_00425 [Candidatus Bathyarchaeia archaeon]